MRRESGFTLLDIMLVISIIGILTAVSYPGIKAVLHNLKLRKEVNKLVTNLYWVRQRAINEEKKWGIIFVKEEDRYLLVKDKVNPAVIKRVKLKEGISFKEITLPAYKDKRAVFFKELGNLDNRNGKVILKLDNLERSIVFSSNAGELNVR